MSTVSSIPPNRHKRTISNGSKHSCVVHGCSPLVLARAGACRKMCTARRTHPLPAVRPVHKRHVGGHKDRENGRVEGAGHATTRRETGGCRCASLEKEPLQNQSRFAEEKRSFHDQHVWANVTRFLWIAPRVACSKTLFCTSFRWQRAHHYDCLGDAFSC